MLDVRSIAMPERLPDLYISACMPPTYNCSLRRWDGISRVLEGRGRQHAKPAMPPGLYMYGGVGVGKTMLMDLLVKCAPSQFQACRARLRVEFVLLRTGAWPLQHGVLNTAGLIITLSKGWRCKDENKT